MKKIQFKKLADPRKRTKTISISTATEDKNSKTQVKKSFVYYVSRTKKVNPKIVPPQIYIKKSFDTRKIIEKFSFQVKGTFYMSHERFLLKVKFHHSLKIHITWKNKVFSPNKSAVLTK